VVAERLVVVGASDQAVVVLDILDRLGQADAVVAVVDCEDAGRLVGRTVAGHTVEQTIGWLPSAGDVAAIPAVGDCNLRASILQRLRSWGVPLRTVIDPTAVVAGHVELGAGTVVSAGAILQVGVRAEDGALINTGAIVDHHGNLGECCHVGPGARLAGGVTVGARAWVGIGATVIDDLSIGTGALIGAGAVVIHDVEAEARVVGVPAKPIRKGEDA
jgi:UDP-perosamine 4-acetyltransferase